VRRAGGVAIACLAVLTGGWLLLLPPRAPASPSASARPPAVRGAIHVHTRRSDGTGTIERVAAAAARAGLRFVVFTDHGDATRIPDPPAYRSGVLCIDAVEISTEGGHVIALDLAAAPYRLGGESRDVVEDVARLGGFAIAAHPLSAKAELRWSDWSAPVGGVEWLNGDSEWRDESTPALLRALLTYPARPAESVASLLDRPDAALEQWDRLSSRRRVVAVAGADAHARIGINGIGEPYSSRAFLPVPSYEAIFRAFSIVLPDIALGGDAAADASTVADAIRRGAVYSVVDAAGGPAAVSFAATGDTIHVTLQSDREGRIALLKDGRELAATSGRTLQHDAAGQPGVYRVEITVPGAPGGPAVPWVLTNALYVGRPSEESPSATPPAAVEVAAKYESGPATGWVVETGARSQGAIDRLPEVGGDEIGFRFALTGTRSESPFAAMSMPAGEEIARFERVRFTGRAARPMRVSVQLRAPAEAGDSERWQRSIFLDETPRAFDIRFDDMKPRGVTRNARPVLGRVTSVLFVVDTVNADPGTAGQFVIDDVSYAR
jgi:hypothetical protein